MNILNKKGHSDNFLPKMIFGFENIFSILLNQQMQKLLLILLLAMVIF